jgi:ABC-type uncharacterized transport system auxiliary subunit
MKFEEQRLQSTNSCLRPREAYGVRGAWILVLGAFLLTGCLSRKPLHKETFAFSLPKSEQVAASTNAPALTLRQITVAAPFDSPSLTYRTGEFSYERDPYAGFLVSPAESLTGPTRAILENSGKFSSVGDSESSVRGNLDLEVSVSQLYGDFRNKSQPVAVLEMHFTLFQPKQRLARSNKTNVAFEKTYTRQLPIRTQTAAAVFASLNAALDEIVTQFANDVPVK